MSRRSKKNCDFFCNELTHRAGIMKVKTGLFFGSFNPIHIGHLAIANYMVEFTDLDQVWFVVSPQNPFKKKQTLLADYHRYALAERAIDDDYPKLKVSNIEFGLPQPSYTVNTLAHLEEKFPTHEFVLIMGADNLKTLHKWKNAEHIIEHYQIMVYPRNGSGGGDLATHASVTAVDAPLMEISSTFIRQAIADKKDVRYMLPASVHDYIREMHFYES